MFNKLVKQINERDIKLKNPFIADNIPNDGDILETIRQLVIDYDDKEFNIYIFKGIFKKTLKEDILNYKFEDITFVEFGKYSFKHPYIKIVFSEEFFLVISYFEYIKSHIDQNVNLNNFIKKLESLELKLRSNEEINEDI